jgi:hypothetical protein
MKSSGIADVVGGRTTKETARSISELLDLKLHPFYM